MLSRKLLNFGFLVVKLFLKLIVAIMTLVTVTENLSHIYDPFVEATVPFIFPHS